MLVKIDQLSAGGAPSRIRQIQSHGKWALDLANFNCTVHANGGLDSDSVVVLAVERACGSTICRIPLEDGMVVTIPAGATISATIQPGLRYAASVIPTALWAEIQALAVGMFAEQVADHPKAVRLSIDQARIVRDQVEATANNLVAAAGDSIQLEQPPDAFLEYLGSLAEARAIADGRALTIDVSPRRYLRQAWAAEDFIRFHIQEDLPIIRLCREVGVSRRQLEYAFRATFAASPLEFIRALRLNEARRQLTTARANGLNVTKVAMDVGITHLGRFATSYRQLFGESPKETFLRAGISWPRQKPADATDCRPAPIE
ncbi:helix-turn-helix domain-containing protein [Mesorhizobium sp. B2-3-14]|nr:helix-turn-helix domain-containing protein [Mesorhizobium sp. B2-4-18]TPL81328.1 helix-turn-helix domain-containing protein [Mesorhizobium sp. B2-3-14]